MMRLSQQVQMFTTSRFRSGLHPRVGGFHFALIWLLSVLGLGVDRGFAKDVRFVAYNLENYVMQDAVRAKAKSEHSKTALVQILSEIRPDILGVCELGSADALEDLRSRLKSQGLEFGEVEMVLGPDPDRKLALLSRFPIVSRRSRAQVSYELNGLPQLVRRGFLDVTVRIAEGGDLRLVGVHLKSKLPIPEGEALVRRMEAQLLRRHVDSILEGEPRTKLIVYGDLNDTREQPTVRQILGEKGSGMELLDIPAEDALGDRWTHCWRVADLYSRIDYLLVNRSLFPFVLKGSGRIWRSPSWKDASDHRPLWLDLRVNDAVR